MRSWAASRAVAWRTDSRFDGLVGGIGFVSKAVRWPRS